MYTCGFRINANLLKEGSFRINAKLVKEELKLTGEQMIPIEPAQVKYTNRLKAVQYCLCYYQNLLNQLRWF